MKLLKFCNIKNIFETRTAASLGVPFLGYHLISENDFARYDDIKYCVQELRNYYPTTKAILVTKERDTKKLSSLIREIEFDGIQLHYPNSNNQAAALKGEFGNKFIVFQVISLESKDFFPTQADYVLLDKSYLGGTGLQISNKDVQKMLNRLKNNKILLAGGISSTNLYRYLDFPVDGFDVQSAIKTDHCTNRENTDYSKMDTLAKLLGYKMASYSGRVGFVIQNIEQQNQQLFVEALDSNVDFFHIDITDGLVGIPTDIPKTRELLETVAATNSHLKIQTHLFLSSQEKFENISLQLGLEDRQNHDVFLHVNKDNYSNFSIDFLKKEGVFFALDIKDITDELFPWEHFVKEQLIVCLDSRQHNNRIQNLNRGLKLIQYSIKLQTIITLDRSVNNEVILGLEDTIALNVVCGSYMRENIKEHYQLLKRYLHGKIR
ncbi:hypothetical protein COX24_02725 [bacterium (Candidatus Gribaldobacteria) CG23_combo_of_CG06-09_8_20_14_all_37_87_8]|uniref:N-(5'-phosphoribosyl)anthranilate isomerase n=1 Tax=bacterium (Candidatus Gribaldobacteria) CG23_combo_of_CG06-09_8_20_14_all_37_87_8 TaxID=2014278 RepID=A0A2G9ZEJ9_9BACT|nr:MAG: hypothetical protein COX24_02725 [bacterium (Candidatus Gribaldobacteria) CG23_combo_of_CG06-09_8_20_14_all_37_87_8]